MFKRGVARLALGAWKAFVSFLCLLSGLSFLIGAVARPQSIEHTLPLPVQLVWNLFLVLGSGLVFYGLMGGRRRPERLGLFLLGGASLVYAQVIWVTAGFGTGMLAACLTLALALAAFTDAFDSVRRWAIGKLLPYLTDESK